MPLPGYYSGSGEIPKNAPLWRPTANGTGCWTRPIPEAASSTFQIGELVSDTTSDTVTMLGGLANPGNSTLTSSLGTTARTDSIRGLALQSASGTTGALVDVVQGDFEVFLRVYSATATNAETQDIKVGDLAEVFRWQDANGVIQTVISPAKNATDGINKVQIVEIPADRSATDQFPGVWVRIRPAWNVLGGITVT